MGGSRFFAAIRAFKFFARRHRSIVLSMHFSTNNPNESEI